VQPAQPEERFEVTIEEILEKVTGYSPVAASTEEEEHERYLAGAEEHDVISLLQDLLEEAKEDLAIARAGNAASSSIEKLERRCSRLSEDLALARRILVGLRTELRRISAGHPSELKAVKTLQEGTAPLLEKTSAQRWLMREFGVHISEWEEHDLDEESIGEPPKDGKPVRAESQNNYELIIGALMELLVDATTNPHTSERYGTSGKPTKSAIADEVSSVIENTYQKKGLGLDTLKNRLGQCERRLKSQN
jgi:hypothetical protein